MRDYMKEMEQGDIICNSAKPWYEKIKDLIYLQYNAGYTTDIVCPYCQTVIKSNEYQEKDFIDISLNDRDEIWYYITMPCCHKRLFVTETYRSTIKSKKEFYKDLQDRLYKDIQTAEKQYYRAKHKYKVICDKTYDEEYIYNWKGQP